MWHHIVVSGALPHHQGTCIYASFMTTSVVQGLLGALWNLPCMLLLEASITGMSYCITAFFLQKLLKKIVQMWRRMAAFSLAHISYLVVKPRDHRTRVYDPPVLGSLSASRWGAGIQSITELHTFSFLGLEWHNYLIQKSGNNQRSYKTVTEWKYFFSTLLPKALIIAKQRKNSFRGQESEVLINWNPSKADVKLSFPSFYPASIQRGQI